MMPGTRSICFDHFFFFFFFLRFFFAVPSPFTSPFCACPPSPPSSSPSTAFPSAASPILSLATVSSTLSLPLSTSIPLPLPFPPTPAPNLALTSLSIPSFSPRNNIIATLASSTLLCSPTCTSTPNTHSARSLNLGLPPPTIALNFVYRAVSLTSPLGCPNPSTARSLRTLCPTNTRPFSRPATVFWTSLKGRAEEGVKWCGRMPETGVR